MSKIELMKNALKWAFGKDGVNLSVYVVLYLLIDYWDMLIQWGFPEPILFVIVGVIVNLDNNALKAIVQQFQNKYEDAKKLVFYMKNGKSYNEAIEILSEKEEKTIVYKFVPAESTVQDIPNANGTTLTIK